MVHNILVLENIYTCLSYFDPASPLDMTKAEDVLEAMRRSPANNWVIGGVTDMSNYDIKIVRLSVENGGGYAAIVPALSGCMSDGETA